MSEIKKKQIFSIMIAGFPLLSVYRSIIPGIDLGTLMLILFYLFSLSAKIYKNEINILLAYILIVTPLVLPWSPYYSVTATTVFLRYGKIIVTLGIVFLFGGYKRYYDEETVFLWMKRVVYISCIFVISQRVMYLFGITLYNPIIRFASYEGYTEGYHMLSGTLFRPSAFFLEPSHLAVYSVVFLIYSLLRKNNLKDAAVVSVAILGTGSGIGLVMTVFVFVMYCLIRFRKHFVRTLGMIIAGTFMMGGLGTFPFFQQVINRFTTDNTMGGGNAIQARIGIGYQFFLEKKLMQQMIGSGYGNVPSNVYLNGITYILNTLGVIGLAVFVAVLVRYFFKGTTWKKVGVLTLFVLTFFSQTFTPSSLVFYLCIFKTAVTEKVV